MPHNKIIPLAFPVAPWKTTKLETLDPYYVWPPEIYPRRKEAEKLYRQMVANNEVNLKLVPLVNFLCIQGEPHFGKTRFLYYFQDFIANQEGNTDYYLSFLDVIENENEIGQCLLERIVSLPGNLIKGDVKEMVIRIALHQTRAPGDKIVQILSRLNEVFGSQKRRRKISLVFIFDNIRKLQNESCIRSFSSLLNYIAQNGPLRYCKKFSITFLFLTRDYLPDVEKKLIDNIPIVHVGGLVDVKKETGELEHFLKWVQEQLPEEYQEFQKNYKQLEDATEIAGLNIFYWLQLLRAKDERTLVYHLSGHFDELFSDRKLKDEIVEAIQREPHKANFKELILIKLVERGIAAYRKAGLVISLTSDPNHPQYHIPGILRGYLHQEELRTGGQPMSERYINFDLHISPQGHVVASSSEGEAEADISLELPLDLQSMLNSIAKRETSTEMLTNVGQILYKWLFPQDIHTHLHQTEAKARSESSNLRLRLRIEAESIASLPLEFLYRSVGGYFMAANPDTVLSRYLNLGLPAEHVHRRKEPLHMLAIISDPVDQVRLNPVEWESILMHSLRKPKSENLITIQTVKRATYEEIRDTLLEKKPDIIQFVGHGIYQGGKGYLALVDKETSKTWLVSDEDFAALFEGYNDNLGLISLATCESAKSDNPQGFLGIAPQLVRLGTPAVVAMYYKVYIDTAKIFLEDFYTSVAARKPIDWAIQQARKAIKVKCGADNREFATPVLYMRAPDGEIF